MANFFDYTYSKQDFRYLHLVLLVESAGLVVVVAAVAVKVVVVV